MQTYDLTHAIKLCKVQRKHKREQSGVVVAVSSVRFSEEDFELFTDMWNNAAYSQTEVEKATLERPGVPIAPSLEQQHIFNEKSKQFETAPNPSIEWNKIVCKHRDRFAQCCIANHNGSGNDIYMLCFALQSPQISYYLKCSRRYASTILLYIKKLDFFKHSRRCTFSFLSMCK